MLDQAVARERSIGRGDLSDFIARKTINFNVLFTVYIFKYKETTWLKLLLEEIIKRIEEENVNTNFDYNLLISLEL